ncbi:MAG: alanine racemase [Clostridia bacterium]|nr:alanine racemase [Clostridia bacterium]
MSTRAVVRIHINKIKNNIAFFREKYAGKIFAVIKANAYGLGAELISLYLENEVDGFCVATVEEGEKIRSCGIKKDIWVLGVLSKEDYIIAADNNLIATISSEESISEIKALEPYSIPKLFVAIDTGMHRLGLEKNVDVEKVFSNKRIKEKTVGLFTHFADGKNERRVFSQLGKLEEYSKIENTINNRLIKSTSSTDSGTTWNCFFECARIGMGLYGIGIDKLQRAVEFISYIVQVKTVRKGEYIGYGSDYTIEKDSLIAVVSAGYADGYPTVFNNVGVVIVRGKKTRVIGRICMDYCMIDATGIPGVSVGDEVLLFGEKNETECLKQGVFHYELLCGIGSRVKREYVF